MSMYSYTRAARRSSTLALLAVFVVITLSSTAAATAQPNRSAADARDPNPGDGAGYVENRGQWDARARFLMRAPGLDTWITDHGIVYDAYRIEEPAAKLGSGPIDAWSTGLVEPAPCRVGDAIKVRFEGASSRVSARGHTVLAGTSNYYIGSERSRWVVGATRFAGVALSELYPGIDAMFYVEDGRPRYDLLVAPGVDPSVIRMRVVGAARVRIGADGVLRLRTSIGEIEQRGLFAYQDIDGKRRPVRCSFTKGRVGTISFRLGRYDRTRPLIIDPVVYSTFFGASGEDIPSGIAVDRSGSVHLAGVTGSRDFPLMSGFDRSYADSGDAFVAKFTPDGRSLRYSTFLGSGGTEKVAGIVVDSAGYAFVAGSTTAAQFPVTTGSYRGGYSDMFVAKIDAGGSRLVHSTFIGGRGYEEATALAIDRAGDIYIIGPTGSDDYPAAGYDGSYNGPSWDIAVTKLRGNGSMAYSTYIGGKHNDNAYAIAVDDSGAAYVAGFTDSDDYPTSLGAYDRTFNGAFDAVVTKLTPDGNEIAFSTMLGTPRDDFAKAIAIGGDGAPWVACMTRSAAFPITEGAFDRTFAGASEVALVKLDAKGRSVLSSTFLGGTSEDNAAAMLADATGTAYLAGWTTSADFPTTADAERRTPQNGDGFVAVFSPDGAIVHSTLLGGASEDVITCMARSTDGVLHIAGRTNGSFPVVGRAYDSTFNGGHDCFIVTMTIEQPSSLFAPGAGVSWCVGATQTIAWTTGASGDVRIELSADSSASWTHEIVARTPAAAGFFAWRIPDSLTPGGRYAIRLVDADDGSAILASSSPFAIAAPPRFTLHPQLPGPLCPGGTIILRAMADGALASSMRWQASSDGLAYTTVVGRGDSLSIGPLTAQHDRKYFRAIVANSCGDDTSSPVRLEVRDTTKPMPDVPVLPVLEASERLTITELPTATDNCAGRIVGTTTDSLHYDVPGSYTIHWTYDDGNGNRTLQEQRVQIGPAGVDDVNTERALRSRSAPTPTRDVVTLSYALPAACEVVVSIHDGLGRSVAVLVDGFQSAGPHAIVWKGLDADGAMLPPGRYTYRIAASDATESGVILIVR